MTQVVDPKGNAVYEGIVCRLEYEKRLIVTILPGGTEPEYINSGGVITDEDWKL
jgi:hypothetical protein